MSKQQYKYNPDSLSYEEINISPLKRVLRLLLWLAPSVIIGLALAYVVTRRIDSPQERELKAELAEEAKEVERLLEDLELYNQVLNDIQGRDEDLYRVALYAEEFPEELRAMGSGGSDKYDYLKGMTNGELLIRASKEMDKIEKRLHAQSISFRELLELAQDKEKMLSCIPAIQPVRNSELKRTISGFGYRIDPIYKTRQMHTGMDFTADRGTEVYATGDGVVELVENKRWGYGKSIVINHGYGYKTLYAHLSGFEVRQGQVIKRGELIGLIGSTGKSTGPHLHYEVIKNGVKVNPIGYYHSDLSPEQYEQLLEMSENSHRAMD
ncbi:MAG: M23 family metallopeptidase [Crocinitomicaceae bacterium]|nr:M23 family metallopeptidase [Crocinitomicaceae bacterium]